MVCLFGIGLVEALRANLEPQLLHVLKDMVVALKHYDILVTYGVVALLVVHIHEGCNLGKCVCNVLHQP